MTIGLTEQDLQAITASADVAVVVATPKALDLIGAVRDHDVDTAHEILDADPAQLRAIALALAAMAHERASFDMVLDYCNADTRRVFQSDARLWSEDDCRAAHAAWNRRDRTPWAARGEREYQRRRAVRRARRRALDEQAMEVRRQERAAKTQQQGRVAS